MIPDLTAWLIAFAVVFGGGGLLCMLVAVVRRSQNPDGSSRPPTATYAGFTGDTRTAWGWGAA